MDGAEGTPPGAPGGAGPRRALLVAHTKNHGAEAAIATASAALEAGGVAVRREEWPGAERLPELVRTRAGEVDIIILGGGDGTMSVAAPGLLDAGLPLGILPLGTANDLARTLAIPVEPAAAAQVILDGHQRRIDLGEINGRPFFNVASIGLSVSVTRELTRDMKRRWGRLAYGIAALRALPRARPFHAEIRCGGEVHHVRTLQIAVGNGRHYGGGMVVEEGAELDDGRLHLYSLEFERAWSLALLLPALRAGRHGGWKRVRTASCEEVEIHTRHPRKVDADGELITETPARFRVLRASLAVLAPVPGEAG